MADVIRTVRLDEDEVFQRFLERCYGHAYGTFPRSYPDRYRLEEDATKGLLVLERDGKIVSHVGTFEMDLVIGPARLKCGAVGGVATLPEHRGTSCMSRLMRESVGRMREWGWPLSVLWGDQQRYSTFGYETCGFTYTVGVTRRSLGWVGVESAEVVERDPKDAELAPFISQLHATLPCRVERPWLAQQLQRPEVRVFTSPDGYLLSRRQYAGDLPSVEVVSPTGREPELILGAMDITFGGRAEVEVGPARCPQSQRLTPVMSDWRARPEGMFRIVDWPLLVTGLSPWLRLQASRVGLPPCSTTVACRWQDDVQWATIEWDGTDMDVSDEERDDGIDVNARDLVSRLLGGPQGTDANLGVLGLLLPVPLHVPSLDHI